MNSLITTITKALKQSRQRRGLSQRALSAKVGMPQSHISRIERGAVDIRLSSLIEMARHLDLEIMLVPRKHAVAVAAIVRSVDMTEPVPAYRLDDEEDENV